MTCTLAVLDAYNNQVMVAKGKAFPPPPSHKALPNHYIVTVIEVFPGCNEWKLPVPVDDGIATTVGEGPGNWLDWPSSLVFWDEDDVRSKVTSAASASSCASPEVPFTIEVGSKLGPGCIKLKSIMSSIASHPSSMVEHTVTVQAPFLYHLGEDPRFITVAVEDLRDFFIREELNVSIIQIYAM